MQAIVHVQVKLFGHLRQNSPQSAVELDMTAGSTISDLLTTLSARLGDEFRQAILDTSGNLHGGIEVVINEEQMPARKVASILLPENCTIYLVPMIEGG